MPTRQASNSNPLLRPDVFEMLLAYKTTAVLSAGIELGVFDAIAAGTNTSVEIADRQQLDPRGARLLLNALAALGLLDADGPVYNLSPGVADSLVRGHAGYVGDMAKVMASKWEWDAAPGRPTITASRLLATARVND
jgi:hypothetical protein